MTTREKLETALKIAMKAGDDVTKRTVRMSLAAIRQVEIDKQMTLDETAVLGIIQKELKTRREAVQEAARVDRSDIVLATNAEIQVLEGFLPAALNAAELQELVDTAIAEVGAFGPTDMGKVMKVLMSRVAGRAPGDQVSAVVRARLQK